MKDHGIGLKDGDLRSIAHVFFGDQSLSSINQAAEFLNSYPSMKTKDIFREFQIKISPKQLVTKSPLYASNLSYLFKLPKHAFFIHLLRNPVTQNRSLKNYLRLLYLNPNNHLYLNFLENQYRGWINEQKNIEFFLKEIPKNRQTKVYSELLMSSPIKVLHDICNFLNISNDEENINRMLHPEKSIFSNLGNEAARFGNDPKFLMNPKFRKPKDIVFEDELPIEVTNIINLYNYKYYSK
jgi:hypothetical protein